MKKKRAHGRRTDADALSHDRKGQDSGAISGKEQDFAAQGDQAMVRNTARFTE